MNLNQSMQILCLIKLSVILEIKPLSYHPNFFNERVIPATPHFQGMSAKNDYSFQKEKMVRIYANSKYLDRNVRWVLFTSAEYIIFMVRLL